MLWFPLALTALAVVFDLRTREIPNTISLVLLAGAAGAFVLGWLPLTGWASISGALLAFGIGGVLFWLGGWGGGDAKLLIGLGAWLGPTGLIAMSFWMAILGGGLAIVALARKKRDYAYAPAIAGGLLVYVLWPHALERLVTH